MSRSHDEALESHEIGIFDINFETGDAYWSNELRHILGVQLSVPARFELFLQCIHPDDRRKFGAAAAKSFQADSPQHTALELRIVSSDGTVRWIHLEAATVFRPQSRNDAVRVVGLVIELVSPSYRDLTLPCDRDTFLAVVHNVADVPALALKGKERKRDENNQSGSSPQRNGAGHGKNTCAHRRRQSR